MYLIIWVAQQGSYLLLEMVSVIVEILDCVPDHMGSSTGKLSAVGDGKCYC